MGVTESREIAQAKYDASEPLTIDEMTILCGSVAGYMRRNHVSDIEADVVADYIDTLERRITNMAGRLAK